LEQSVQVAVEAKDWQKVAQLSAELHSRPESCRFRDQRHAAPSESRDHDCLGVLAAHPDRICEIL
jgi:hypothetical protein